MARNARFTITLAQASNAECRVSYVTVDDTAIAGTHYTESVGTLVFRPGETEKNVDVLIGSTIPGSPVRRFFMTIYAPRNCIAMSDHGTCIIPAT